MITAGQLTERTKKDLAEMARRRGVRGWEAMNKDDLVRAIVRQAKKTAGKPAPVAVKAANKPAPAKTVKHAVKPAAKPVPKQRWQFWASRAVAPARPGPAVANVESNGSHRAAPSANGATTLKFPPQPKPAQASPQPKPAQGPAQPKTQGSLQPKPPQGSPHAKPQGSPQPRPPQGSTQPRPPQGSPQAKPGIPAAKNSQPQTATALAKPELAKVTSGKPAQATPPREAAKEIPPPRPVVTGPTKDRIIMAVHDPYWLHVYWELSNLSVQRAEAALKQDWYGARLIIRLYDVTSHDTTSTSETPIRDIPIESDGSNWYINVQQPPRQYRADLGYLSRRGILFVLARSNVVTPPKAGSAEAMDAGWNMDTKKAERISAMSTGFETAGNPDLREMFEERLKRSLGAPKETAFGTGATPPGSLKKFFFDIDAKLIVLGRTDPSAHLTLGNDPIKLNSDGTFSMLFSLPDSRQIIPAVATSADGVEERTIVLAVERNTKYLDPMIHDQMNEI